MRVGVLQLNAQSSLEANFKQIETCLAQVKSRELDYILLPENFSFMGNENEKRRLGSAIESTTLSFLQNLANRLESTITGGGFPVLKNAQHFANTAMTLNASGQIIHRYEKIHLFDANPGDAFQYRESSSTINGDTKLTLFKLPPWNIGVSICYDIRFPELYRRYSKLGAHILTNSAAFTEVTGKAHWEVLLRARAIENTCYVLASAQTGNHYEGRKTFGHSMIISPWGDILAKNPDEVGLITHEINLDLLMEVRNRLPSLNHRRLD